MISQHMTTNIIKIITTNLDSQHTFLILGEKQWNYNVILFLKCSLVWMSILLLLTCFFIWLVSSSIKNQDASTNQARIRDLSTPLIKYTALGGSREGLRCDREGCWRERERSFSEKMREIAGFDWIERGTLANYRGGLWWDREGALARYR